MQHEEHSEQTCKKCKQTKGEMRYVGKGVTYCFRCYTMKFLKSRFKEQCSLYDENVKQGVWFDPIYDATDFSWAEKTHGIQVLVKYPENVIGVEFTA